MCVGEKKIPHPERERVGVIPTRKCGRVIFFGITDLLFQWVGEGGVVTVLSVVGSRQRLREERGETQCWVEQIPNPKSSSESVGDREGGVLVAERVDSCILHLWLSLYQGTAV